MVQKLKTMKQKILFSLSLLLCIGVSAQKKGSKVTAYAITGTEKGQSNWSEVRLIDISTGDEIQSIYKSSQEPSIFNARTGKQIVKKEQSLTKDVVAYKDLQPMKKEFIIFNDGKAVNTNPSSNINVNTISDVNVNTDVHTRIIVDNKLHTAYVR